MGGPRTTQDLDDEAITARLHEAYGGQRPSFTIDDLRPPAGTAAADRALEHIAAAALDAIDNAPPDPTLDELVDALEASSRPRSRLRPQVLLADSDEDSRRTLADVLVEGGCEVVATLRTGVPVAYVCRVQQPTVVVMDLELRPSGVWGALQLLALLSKECPHVPVLALARPEPAPMTDLPAEAVNAGASLVLTKPVSPDELVGVVHRLHHSHVQAAYPAGGAGNGSGEPGGDVRG